MRNSIRMLAALGAAVALLPFGVTSVLAAATAEKVVVTDAQRLTTPIDSAIDALVASKTRELKLSANDARIAREQLQLQFRSLPEAKQQELSAAATKLSAEGSIERLSLLMDRAMRDNALQALATASASATKSQGFKAEDVINLGPSSSDLVFVPTAGPCRVYDSRFGPGIFAPTESRQVWVWSVLPNYSWGGQGGTGTSSTGNCVGSQFIGTPEPLNVVATVTILNTNTTGALRAWNGGTTLVTGAVHAWNPGQTSSNTTVIPIDRNIAAYAGSGAKRDAGINNNSGGNVDVIIDVVGYFINNLAVALDCYTEFAPASTSIPNGANTTVAAPACVAGFTNITAVPFNSSFGVWVNAISSTSCRLGNNSGGSTSVYCDMRCCRVPGN